MNSIDDDTRYDVIICANGLFCYSIKRSVKKSVRSIGFLKPFESLCPSKDVIQYYQSFVSRHQEAVYILLRKDYMYDFFVHNGVKNESIVIFLDRKTLIFGNARKVLNVFKVVKEIIWKSVFIDSKYNGLFLGIVENKIIQYLKDNHARVLLIGIDNKSDKYLKSLDSQVLGLISDESLEEKYKKFLIDYADLLYLNPQDEIWILINDNKHKVKVKSRLSEIGMLNCNVLAYGEFFDHGNLYGGKRLELFDPLVGYVWKTKNIPSFIRFGDESAQYRIIALGGSTTDPFQGNLIGWAEYLYIMLCNAGYNVEILVGGWLDIILPRNA